MAITKPHESKLNSRTYAISMSKHIPNNSANLAYISSPEITDRNVSIVNENVGVNLKENYSEIHHLHTVTSTNFVTEVTTRDILVTDEFSLKVYPEDTPQPLFYIASLKSKIRISGDNRFVPYQYGYVQDAENKIKEKYTGVGDALLATPLIYKETFESNEPHPMISIMCDGQPVKAGFKFKMTKEGTSWKVDILNNFDQDKIYRVTYSTPTGPVTETLNSRLLFTGVDYDDLAGLGETACAYALVQNGGKYEVYCISAYETVDDTTRKPFEFKYRVLGNLRGSYSRANPCVLKTGIVFFGTSDQDDMHSLLVAFNDAVGSVFPGYISFMNPHPISIYSAQTPEYKMTPNYWDIDLGAPQDHINDYDIIFITGYGEHDLSYYNSKLVNYLNAGGKIVIDNISNQGLEILNIGFGTSSPIVSYQMAVPISTAVREFGPLAGYNSRYYTLSDNDIANIGYKQSSALVAPGITLSSEAPSHWEDIIRYNAGQRSVAIKTFNGRGKVILSNCGILKGFTHGSSDETRKFVTNLVLTLAEDIWKISPWISDRVLHKNQLYKQEYTFENYVADINPLAGDQIIARKILAGKVSDFLSRYTGVYNLEGTYYIDAFEKDTQGKQISMTNIYMPSRLEGGEPLYAFAKSTANTGANSTNIFHYSNVRPVSDTVKFDVAITPFTFRWSNVNGTLVQERLEASASNRSKITFEIKRDSGNVNLGLLTQMLPAIPGGSAWADKAKVFFKIEVSGYVESPTGTGKWINPIENRVNLHIYDKLTGRYTYSSDGENIISYENIYTDRYVSRDNGLVITKNSSNDIILQASTGYYKLVASARVFAVMNDIIKQTLIELPKSLNTNESWLPRIRYTHFIKDTFDKDDYDKIAQAMYFRLEREQAILDAKRYFGEDYSNNDPRIVAALTKLEAGTLTTKDFAVIAGAFNVIPLSMSYEYDIDEYFHQYFDPYEGYPYRRVVDEVATYVNPYTVKVQYGPIYVSEGTITNGELVRLASTVYECPAESITGGGIVVGKAINWKSSLPITVEMETATTGVWEDCMSNVDHIDHLSGLVFFKTPPERAVRASFTYSNASVVRKTYSNMTATMEKLTKISDDGYMIRGMRGKKILSSPSPVITVRYTNGESKIVSPLSYNIMNDSGLIILKEVESGDLYITYTYAIIEMLDIANYDAKNGIIELNDSIHFNDNIYVSYLYREDYYDYSGYYDHDIGRFMYVDLNPTRGHECTYPTVDSSVTPPVVTYKEVPTYKLLGKTLYLYMLPVKVIRDGAVSELGVNAGENTVRHTFSKEELDLLQIAYPEMLYLGSIKLMNNYNVYDVTTLDTRKCGGGLKESISSTDIEKTNELSLNLWDILPFDGRSYHPNGLTIITLPATILVENGGNFTREDVQQTVEKHLALGVVPIINYE